MTKRSKPRKIQCLPDPPSGPTVHWCDGFGGRTVCHWKIFLSQFFFCIVKSTNEKSIETVITNKNVGTINKSSTIRHYLRFLAQSSTGTKLKIKTSLCDNIIIFFSLVQWSFNSCLSGKIIVLF